MIHRTARERLLFEAGDAAEGVESLEGIRGHTATLERSENGPARMVRVWCDGAVVSWAFTLEPGEDRPGFYPMDVPFLPDLLCEMLWDDETGLVVKWSERLDAHGRAEFRERIASLDLSADKSSAALSSLTLPGREDAVASQVRDIVAFHEAAGWSRTSDTGRGPIEKVWLRSGDAERTVLATTFGTSVIILGEKVQRTT